jgi:repressor of nif and glnA expression
VERVLGLLATDHPVGHDEIADEYNRRFKKHRRLSIRQRVRTPPDRTTIRGIRTHVRELIDEERKLFDALDR